MICGHRVGDRGDLRGQRVDVEGDPDDDDAVVVGAGERRGDRDQAQRGALERARQVHLARPRGTGACPGPAATLVVPIWLDGRAARAAPARRGRRSGGRGGDRRLRAVGDPAQVAGEAGRHPEVEVAEELVAVVAVELQVEVAEGAGDRVRRAGHEARVEGPDLARAGAAVRARVEAEDRRRGLVGERRVPGHEDRVGAVDARSGSASPPGRDREAKRWRLNSSNGTCGRSSTRDRQLPGLRVGVDRRRPASRGCRSRRRS